MAFGHMAITYVAYLKIHDICFCHPTPAMYTVTGNEFSILAAPVEKVQR